jgi:indole-3-glycerol phosphate synthase
MEGIRPTQTILDRIVETKIKEVEKLQRLPKQKPPERRHSKNPGHDFLAALKDSNKKGRIIIAEIKMASPSAGLLRDPFDPEEIAISYQNNGARCISVITDEQYFKGSLRNLRLTRKAVDIPILRKDFIIDPLQIEEAAWAGADAILLIARILAKDLLQQLYTFARKLSLAVLVEVHNEQDMEKAAGLDPVPELIGVNNRNLSNFEVSIDVTKKLLPMIPEGSILISESGLSKPKVLDELIEAGTTGFLIGTSLVKAKDPGLALGKLVYDREDK